MKKKTLPTQGEIFSVEKYYKDLRTIAWTVRRGLSIKVRWGLVLVGILAVIIPALFVGPSYILGTSDTLVNDPPLPTDSPVAVLPTTAFPVTATNPTPSPFTTTTDGQINQQSLQQITQQIGSFQQQISAQVSQCIQIKQQTLNQLRSVHQSDLQLQAQIRGVNDAMSRINTSTTGGQNQFNTLQAQATRLQNDETNVQNNLSLVQQQTDQQISACQSRVQQLQDQLFNATSLLSNQLNQFLFEPAF